MQLFAEKGDFSNKKRPKRDPKSGLGLLRDPGLPKRDPVGSSAPPPKHVMCHMSCVTCHVSRVACNFYFYFIFFSLTNW